MGSPGVQIRTRRCFTTYVVGDGEIAPSRSFRKPDLAELCLLVPSTERRVVGALTTRILGFERLETDLEVCRQLCNNNTLYQTDSVGWPRRAKAVTVKTRQIDAIKDADGDGR